MPQFVQTDRHRLQYPKQISYGSVVLAAQRYRTNKVKRMHSILEGLLPILEAMAECPDIDQINPGRISASRRAGNYTVTVQYFTSSGLKLLARSPSGVQEVFVVTSEPETVERWLLESGITQQTGNKRTTSETIAGSQRTRPRSTSIPQKKRRRSKSSSPPPQPSATAPPAGQKSSTTVSDHLSRDTVDKLRQLPRHQSPRHQKSGVPSARLNGAKTSRTSAPVKRKSQTAPAKNPLEVWLEQVSDDDIRRLAHKLKGKDI
ncbi:MAG: DUF2103 domain-containing protein [Limnochordia bacterium]|jgi:hypothetical protein